MRREVRFVDDSELAGRPYVFALMGDTMYLFVRQSAVTPEVLTEAWSDFCAEARQRPPLLSSVA